MVKQTSIGWGFWFWLSLCLLLCFDFKGQLQKPVNRKLHNLNCMILYWFNQQKCRSPCLTCTLLSRSQFSGEALVWHLTPSVVISCLGSDWTPTFYFKQTWKVHKVLLNRDFSIAATLSPLEAQLWRLLPPTFTHSCIRQRPDTPPLATMAYITYFSRLLDSVTHNANDSVLIADSLCDLSFNRKVLGH